MWPNSGNSPLLGEKVTQCEGGFRVPCIISWPGIIRPGTLLNDIISHEDTFPTLMAAAGPAKDRVRFSFGIRPSQQIIENRRQQDAENSHSELTSKNCNTKRSSHL